VLQENGDLFWDIENDKYASRRRNTTSEKKASFTDFIQLKPGNGLTYADSQNLAKEKGGRLLTLLEARAAING
jgi:hypothetical protein